VIRAIENASKPECYRVKDEADTRDTGSNLLEHLQQFANQRKLAAPERTRTERSVPGQEKDTANAPAVTQNKGWETRTPAAHKNQSLLRLWVQLRSGSHPLLFRLSCRLPEGQDDASETRSNHHRANPSWISFGFGRDICCQD
jgi:hypothetical protein